MVVKLSNSRGPCVASPWQRTSTQVASASTTPFSTIMYRNRPFVSPLLKRPISSNGSDTEVSLEKKARHNVAKPLQHPIPDEVPRTPLLNLQVPNYSLTGRETPKEGYFNVLWRNPTTKKNKTWDGDGVLVLEEGFLTLRDSDGKK